MEERELLKKIVGLLDEKKGEDIVAFKINEVSSLADYILICTANSEVHGRALAETLIEEMKKKRVSYIAVEGKENSQWICVDYGEIIVHIMTAASREFYHLESIWGACEKITSENMDLGK
ncbi:ribosome silencing factor [Flexistipes sp.]|uniref:ribosome silencing factor n=1 Tax=Flexistipes sp. TaxID=3088135 RepID=UPI002E1A4573|nr:ribosome silencing factor [Flexistipes sp.]